MEYSVKISGNEERGIDCGIKMYVFWDLAQDGKNSGTLNGSDRLCLILSKEDKAVPMDKLKIILYIYAYTFVVLICRGGKTFDSLIGL